MYRGVLYRYIYMYIYISYAQRNATVEDLSKGFETNILNSFSPEALATAAQEIVDVRT
jgi:hypothetical protein